MDFASSRGMDAIELHFRPVTEGDDPALSDVVSIYTAGIPRAERKAVEWIAHAVTRPDFVMLVAVDGEGKTVGFSLSYAPAGEAMALVEYLAVDANSRGRGVGTALFSATRILLAGRTILFEVESVPAADRAKDAGSTVAAARGRQRFYRRMGCRRVRGLIYALPLNSTPPPPVMELFVANAPAELRRAMLMRWLGCVYRDVYGVDRDDPRLAAMAAWLGEIVAFD